MWSMLLLLSLWTTISSGNIVPRFQGCFSTSVVVQYGTYYRLNHSMSPPQAVAACNSRLTRYMGLECDESYPNDSYVYCGNDLAEVSPKADHSQCHSWQIDLSFYYGRNGSMSVYLLRDSTPLSLLLATDEGVEMLSDNMTTLISAYYNTSSYKYIDYLYNENVLVLAINTSFLRSHYNYLTMKFTTPYSFFTQLGEALSLSVDSMTCQLYYIYVVNRGVYRGTILGRYREAHITSNEIYPDQISIDPYNRILVFLRDSGNTVHIYSWRGSGHIYRVSLQGFQVDKIYALSMDVHDMLLYAILTYAGDESIYLVSLDYGLSKMRVLFSGPQLKNSRLLEVFRGDAVWVGEGDMDGTSTVFQCKLAPLCELENLSTYPFNRRIYDFTIYHPEKQTPGLKRLCANMTCPQSCQLFTPFTAICVQYSSTQEAKSTIRTTPGYPGYSTDSSTQDAKSTIRTTPGYSTDSSTQEAKSTIRTTPGYPGYSTVPSTRTDAPNTATASRPSSTPFVTPNGNTVGFRSVDLSTPITTFELPKSNDVSAFPHSEILIGLCFFVGLVLLIVISLFFYNVKISRVTQQCQKDIMELRLERKSSENHYMLEPFA